jgi:starch synthase
MELPMRIAFLSPEVWPFTRVGGLAEVSHDLGRALAARGHKVDLITIKQNLDPDLERMLEETPHVLEVPISWRTHQARVMLYKVAEGLNLYLICQDSMFNRDGLYGNAYGGYEDNAERFIFFSRACLELLRVLGRPVDLVHANDWTSGLVPLYLKTIYSGYPEFRDTASLMTVHNLGNQGMFWHYDMPLTGLGWEYFTPEAIEFFGKISFLKAGLVFADMVSTVSPSYLKEMLNSGTGMGLEGILHKRKDRLAVVVNGVDQMAWNPSSDPAIIAHFSPENLENKAKCKADLQSSFNLPPGGERPLLVFVGRLVDRRGLDVLISALEGIIGLGMDVAVMGFGDDRYHKTLTDMAGNNQGRLGVHIGYDMYLAHKMMAGGDMLIMPSRYEPCGLHQMHAMRYGTVPVVRATGGLDDTVEQHCADNPGVGFKFQDYTPGAILSALENALSFYHDKTAWQGIMLRGMQKDFSWESAAASYEDIYIKAVNIRRGNGER